MGARSLPSPVCNRQLSRSWLNAQCRSLSHSSQLASGHNRWSKIKHDKGKEDAAKSKIRSYLSQDVILASKLGGPDPKLNPRLAIAITHAKKGALSKTSIEAAIARGQGKSTSGAALESLTIEAMLPFSVAAVIECQTDQKLRVLQDVRFIISRNGGSVTPTSYLFEKKGRIVFEKMDGIGPDEILEQAIEAGATDVDVDSEGQLVVDTEPSDVSNVSQKLTELVGLKIERSAIIYDPRKDTMVTIEEKDEAQLSNIISLIEEDPSVQDVYINAA